jgi:hypothetical protein
MNHDVYPSDNTLTRELRDALAEVAAPERPPLAAITSRGRAHRHRQLARVAGAGVAGVAAGTALTLGLTGILGAAPVRGTGGTGTTAPAHHTGTIRTAAFTLTGNANGTDTLTLTGSQMLNPAALQQALAQHGIPALVKINAYCSSNPEPRATGVVSIRPHGQPAAAPGVPVPNSSKAGDVSGGPNPSDHRTANDTVTVINPALMPAGTELFFGYFNSNHALATRLIYKNSYTCSG